jgi:hypothetical protein
MRFVRRATEDFAENIDGHAKSEVIVAEKTVFQSSFTSLYETSAENLTPHKASGSGALKSPVHHLQPRNRSFRAK